MKYDGCAPTTARYRVTDASVEEESRGSLETLPHVRIERPRDEGGETVGQFRRTERKRFGRNNGADAARGTYAALMDYASSVAGISETRMVFMGTPVQAGSGYVDMSLPPYLVAVM
jgi:hypothetical protein